MALILVEKDGKNRVAKEVTTDQRTAIMAKSRIWDVDAAGVITAGPFGPTNPDPVPVPAAGITNDGTTATDTVAREMATAASTAANSALASVVPLTPAGKAEAWTYGGMHASWEQLIEGLPLRTWEVFGSAQSAPPIAGGVAYTDATTLAQGYQPLPVVQDLGGNWLDGTFETVINGEWQKYRPTFVGSPNHVFGTDYLTLQATIDSGHTFELGPMGDVQSSGVTLNYQGSAVSTPIANAGWSSGDLSSLGVGRCVSSPDSYGYAVITDQTSTTVTLESVTGGSVGASPSSSVKTGAFRMEVMPMFAHRTKQALTKGSLTTIVHETALHSAVQPGWQVAIGLNGYQTYAAGYALVASISGDRKTVTYTASVGIDYSRPADTSGNGWFVIYSPPIWSGQIAAYHTNTWHFPGKKAMARELVFSFPKISSTYMGEDLYTRAAVAAMRSANPDLVGGIFNATWDFMTRRNPANRNSILSVANPITRWGEIDDFETWLRIGNGGIFRINNNMHSWDGTKTAVRRVAHELLGIFVGSEQASFSTTSGHMLQMYDTLFDGKRHTLRTLRTNNGYWRAELDGKLWNETYQPVNLSYGYQHVMNCAVGNRDGSHCFQGFHPWRTSDIARTFMRIYSKKEWEL